MLADVDKAELILINKKTELWVNVENDQGTAKAKFAVPYVAWGMKDSSSLVLRVDKSVDVEVFFIGTQASARRRPNGLSHCSRAMERVLLRKIFYSLLPLPSARA
jgi:hypothetical protein